MKAVIVSLVSIIILIGIGLGVTHVINPDLIEATMNKFNKTKVLTIHDAYKDPSDASTLEEELYVHYDGAVVPLFFSESDLSRLHSLDKITFGNSDLTEVEGKLKEALNAYPPKPYLLASNSEGKNLCFMTALDDRDSSSKAPFYYQSSKCKIGFENFKVLIEPIIPKEEVLDAAYKYKEFYNQKQDVEQIADETLYEYYFNVYAGIDASLQAMRKGEGLTDIVHYLDQKEKNVDAPAYMVSDFDRPFTMRLIREVQAGNIPLEIDTLTAFKITYESLKGSVPHYTVLSAIMNQKEIEDRGNFAREAVLQSDEFKTIKSIN